MTRKFRGALLSSFLILSLGGACGDDGGDTSLDAAVRDGSVAADGSVTPSCDDGIQNADETDTDCGGATCDPCVVGDDCMEAADCLTGVCDPAGMCVEPTCTDGSMNGDETGVDCGGGSCAPCADGEMCAAPEDCESGVCDGTCAAPVCGDSVVNDDGETCDDGGESATCDDDCSAAMCGDSVVNEAASESCDDGGESATCDADCTTAMCGDGTPNTMAGEACDDGGESATCDADCTAVMCGDGTPNTMAGEACDDGGESATCDADCTAVMCGDGVVNMAAGEDCDDSGESASCDADCTAVVCGDGTPNTTAGEICDDGGESATCDVDCTAVTCGDGTANTTAGEACDDGGESATCDADCTAVMCGDGVVNMAAGEECDDGGMVPGDGCSVTCTAEVKTVFVTSTMYTGDMGGLTGADTLCQSHADAAGLSGTYMAWLSTGTASPSTRFTPAASGYQRVDGVMVASSWADLIDGTLLAPINVTETGGTAPVGNTSCAGGGAPTVWSNTNTNGTALSADVCGDFTSTSGGGRWGRADQVDQRWTSWCSGGLCSWVSPIYCFEQ